VRRLLHIVLVSLLVPSGWALAQAQPEHPLGAIGAFFDRLFHGAPPAPKPQLHYVVGSPYELDGTWQYPRERFSYDETGIAGVYRRGHPPETTDGETFDLRAMAAAHRTSQLPAIALVTNLENGRQVLLRINDRGPVLPTRVVLVTPRVAQLLAFGSDGTARVRVMLDSEKSQALAQELHGGAGSLAITAAPVGAVQATPLAPPGGSAAAQPSLSAQVASDASAQPGRESLAPAAVPLRLPEALTQVAPQPGTLWIECDSFTHYAYADRERAKLAGLGAQVLRRGTGTGENDTVRIGPIGSVAEADALLNRVLRSGVGSARIVVEQE
jgi:rare lipoprotein A